MEMHDDVTNVPMNSPECIKKKLDLYSARYLSGSNWGREILGTGEIMHNAFFYIQQLESQLAQVERERDAAVADFTSYVNTGESECHLCRKSEEVCLTCNWQWRGVKINDE